MSFSAPLELSIQMEECMENTGFNRSELIKAAVLAYIKSQHDKKKEEKKMEDTYKVVLEIRDMVSQLLK
jgi:metal-responsive CopG/Arc/MetJ family transcriptional regulator